MLLPEKCVFWPSKNTIFISDLHLGKIDHFRKNGVAVPGSASLDNYKRLEVLIKTLSPRHIIFLGDLFHSKSNADWEVCKLFIAGYPNITFDLILGNHDILQIEELKYTFDQVHLTGLKLGPFYMSHEPIEHKTLYNICGHIHPAYKLKVHRQPSIRLPCFYFNESQCILPAFGTFTGMHTISPEESSKIYVIADKEVIQVQ